MEDDKCTESQKAMIQNYGAQVNVSESKLLDTQLRLAQRLEYQKRYDSGLLCVAETIPI